MRDATNNRAGTKSRADIYQHITDQVAAGIEAGAGELRAVLDGILAEGEMQERDSLRQVATALEARGVRAPQGVARSSAAQVRRVLAHAGAETGRPYSATISITRLLQLLNQVPTVLARNRGYEITC